MLIQDDVYREAFLLTYIWNYIQAMNDYISTVMSTWIFCTIFVQSKQVKDLQDMYIVFLNKLIIHAQHFLHETGIVLIKETEKRTIGWEGYALCLRRSWR